jgi:hypothetical protein
LTVGVAANLASPVSILGITLRWLASEGNMIESRTAKKVGHGVLCVKKITVFSINFTYAAFTALQRKVAECD